MFTLEARPRASSSNKSCKCLSFAEVDPYTDIVLSSCCTDYQQPNAKVTDQGRTITAIRGISKGEEVVTHSGAPHAALQSAGLVRLIASSTLARAMHMVGALPKCP
eukprot:225674-Pelagomonas_calceolata.AAC.7